MTTLSLLDNNKDTIYVPNDAKKILNLISFPWNSMNIGNRFCDFCLIDIVCSD